MKGFASFLTVSFLVFIYNQSVLADNNVSDGTGNELINYCADVNEPNNAPSNWEWWYCMGLVVGVADGLSSGAYGGVYVYNNKLTTTELKKRVDDQVLRYCVPENVTRRQMALVVTKYLKDHPESLNESQSDIVLDAFRAAWPCAK